MLTFVFFVLVVALLLYTTLAGADLGAGILEIFKGKKLREEQEKLIEKAMGPVWEANHVWIILVVVIFFVGFPKAFSELAIVFHIPITAMLIGIMFRGCAFTFRHYDAIKDSSQNLYSLFFSYSSLWTTFWMGVVCGALVLGNIPVEKVSFAETYLLSWLHPFPMLVGLFLCALFSYTAATLLIAESPNDDCRELFKRRAIVSHWVALLLGAGVLIYGTAAKIATVELFFESTLCLTLFALSALLNVIQWLFLKEDKLRFLKFLGLGQPALILLGWLFAQYPYLYYSESGSLSLVAAAAPDATILQLTIALAIGIVLIFPPYFYLLKVFKSHI